MSDDHLDPNALQIEKERVKTVHFNPEEDVIPISDGEGEEEEEEEEGEGDRRHNEGIDADPNPGGEVERGSDSGGSGSAGGYADDVSVDGVGTAARPRRERSRTVPIVSSDLPSAEREYMVRFEIRTSEQ